MLQYIITTTLIWAVSIMFYFLFLRKETFFHWNRLYLAGTCLLGIMIPFYSFKAPAPSADSSSLKYFNQVVSAKEEIIQPAMTHDIAIGIESILWFIYTIGCVVTLFFFCRELIIIYRMHKKATSYTFQQWKIIETNLQHTPFSWRRLLFISKKENYTPEEFDIISRHENVHLRKIHYADILLLSVLQILFWFNPLVYIYKYLIKLTHEFEADSYKINNTETYGQFLIEQAIGTFQPALLHTFSSSPLKNRIMMLTQKKSTRLKAMKYLAIIPLLLFSFVMVTYAQNKLPVRRDLGNGKFEYMGNIFEEEPHVKAAPKDTLQMKSNSGETISIAITGFDATPEIMNGKKIQNPGRNNCSMPVLNSKGQQLSVYLFTLFKSDFEKLPDNEYEIKSSKFIIDEKGKVAFIQVLEVGGLSLRIFSKPALKEKISDETEAILQKLSERMKLVMLFNTSFSPGRVNSIGAVPAFYWEDGRESKKIVVKNGQAIITKNTD